MKGGGRVDLGVGRVGERLKITHTQTSGSLEFGVGKVIRAEVWKFGIILEFGSLEVWTALVCSCIMIIIFGTFRVPHFLTIFQTSKVWEGVF